MTMLATFKRDAAAGVDDQGHPAPADWQPHAVDTPCFAYQKSQTQIHDGTKITQDRIMAVWLPIGTDITEADRIDTVIDSKGGVVIAAGDWPIRTIRIRQSRIELEVEPWLLR